MNRLLLPVITCVGMIMCSCATTDRLPDVAKPDHRTPKSNAEQLFLRDNTTINTESKLRDLARKLKGSTVKKESNRWVWDLNGGVLRGDKQSGDGGQSEDQEPLMRVKIPLLIKDGFVKNNKDAITFYGPDSGIDRITFLDVGEDAVATSRGAYRVTVKDSEFINNRKGDKSIQLNEAKDALIDGNLIYSGRTGARIGDSDTTSVKELAKARNNHFIGVDTAYHASKITVDVNEGSDKYEKVRQKFKTSNGAKIK